MFSRDRQLSFVEHLVRENDGMEHQIIETEMVGKRARGRPRKRMFEWMTTRLNVRNAKNLGDIAIDREKWRKSKQLFFNGRRCHDTRRSSEKIYYILYK